MLERKKMESNRKEVIIHVASEVVPFSKAGGLGDVVGVLPRKIQDKRSNFQNLVFTPYYANITPQIAELEGEYEVEFNNVPYKYDVFQCEQSCIEYYFIKMDNAFALDNIYVDGSKPYLVDVGLEYFFFGKCIIDYLIRKAITPSIWITHDWHAAGIYGYLKDSHSIHIIHNYNHQGQLYYDIIPYLDDEVQEVAEEIYKETNAISMNSFAIKNAEKIVTVSKSYAEELKKKSIAHPGLELFDIYNKDIVGIMNGVDYEKWNSGYTIDELESKKKEAKRKIKKQYGIGTDDSRPLILMMSRLTYQKGIDIFVNMHNRIEFDIYKRLENFINIGFDLMICGVPAGGIGGEVDNQLKSLMERYGENFVYINSYTDDRAHELLMGADYLLHVSNYEPCGLTPMYAMNYGVIPIVSQTGGLKDIVRNAFDSEQGANGFVILNNDVENLEKDLDIIINQYDDGEIEKIRLQAIKTKFEWDTSVQTYCKIIDHMLVG